MVVNGCKWLLMAANDCQIQYNHGEFTSKSCDVSPLELWTQQSHRRGKGALSCTGRCPIVIDTKVYIGLFALLKEWKYIEIYLFLYIVIYQKIEQIPIKMVKIHFSIFLILCLPRYYTIVYGWSFFGDQPACTIVSQPKATLRTALFGSFSIPAPAP